MKDYIERGFMTLPLRNARILLSEGSSLSARQAITTLGLRGYELEICDPDPFCIGRFSRFVRRFHRCPALGKDPKAYLRFIVNLISARRFDVLLPMHEQGFLFARAQEQIAPFVHIALPSFENYETALNKSNFSRLLSELDLQQPRTTFARTVQELLELRHFPLVLKSSIGTASRGVLMVENFAELTRAAAELEHSQAFDDLVLVQQKVSGPLERAQAVFSRGSLIGIHGYRQAVVGAGGGDAVKESVSRPEVRAHLAQIGRRLAWNGALSVDYILQDGTPLYIDCNPRLVEPVNALLSGVDLADLLVRISLGESPVPAANGHEGIRTHMAILALLGCSIRSGSRREVLRECRRLMLGCDPYTNSREELTPISLDRLSLVPLAIVAMVLLGSPKAARGMSVDTARSHQLNPQSVRIIRENHTCFQNVPLSQRRPPGDPRSESRSNQNFEWNGTA
jgi:predicted ATP-grasp superfamily ATP-dependent carboligase